nr:ABC transporter permease [Chitinophagaceae bacterium]
MNISFFIANKIAFQQKKSFSSFIVKIAIIAIALSTGVMIVGTAITKGYQKVISEKFYDCWGEIHITNFLPDPSHILNDEKFDTDSTLIKNIAALKEVKSVHTYSIQSCLLKTKESMESILLKGLDNAESKLLSPEYLIEGEKISFEKDKFSEQIILSKTTADKLQLKVNDRVVIYFLHKNEYQPKARKVRIVGIYQTGLEDYDNHFILCDGRLINHINNDSSQKIQGYEIYLHDHTTTQVVEKNIFENFIDAPLQIYPIEKRFANIFSWLEMMKMNELIIVLIMLIIAVINMITALLILIMERTQMIGILKSLGMPNAGIRNIFMYTSFYIISAGVLMGALLGVGLCLLQAHFGIISLDEAVYYVNKVPIYLEPSTVASIIVGTILICLSLLLIPIYIIRTISPTKALKFN